MSKYFVRGVFSVEKMEKSIADLFPFIPRFYSVLNITLNEKSFTTDVNSEDDAGVIAERALCLCSEITIGKRFLSSQNSQEEKPEIEDDDDFLPPENLPRDPHKIGLKGGNLKALDAERQILLARPISDLNLVGLEKRCMKYLMIETIGDLTSRTANDLLEIKNFGVRTLEKVRKKLANFGLKLKGD